MALSSGKVPPLDELRRAVDLLAKATRDKIRILAGEVARGRLENYLQETHLKSDCTDTLSSS